MLSVQEPRPGPAARTHLTVLLKQKQQKRCPHWACRGLRRIFSHELHKCLSSRQLARIFLGKPGLLPSREDGGEGSWAAINPEQNRAQWGVFKSTNAAGRDFRKNRQRRLIAFSQMYSGACTCLCHEPTQTTRVHVAAENAGELR